MNLPKLTRDLLKYALVLPLASPALAGPLFEDLSATLPHHVYDGGWEHFVGGGVAVFDCNGDRLPDMFAAGGRNPAKLLINRGDLRFTKGDAPALLHVTGAYPLDIDGDGALDLFVMRVGANIALRGDGNCNFTDFTNTWGIDGGRAWTTSFTARWADGDDRPTMAVGNYVDRDDPDGPFEACDDNQILRPIEGGYGSEPLSPGFCALSMLAARDARGRQTLRISNDRHYYVRGGYEQMYDLTENRFLTEADGWRKVSLWGMGIASRDLTGDGRDEVMLTSMGDQLLQIAQPDGTYAAAPFDMNTYAHRPFTGGDGRPSTGWHAQFGDVDNDGRADLFIAKGNVEQMPDSATRDPNNLLIQQPDGRFEEAAAAAGVATMERSRGAALADFDLDGRLDLVVVNRRAPMELYRNITPDAGRWIAVDLRRASGNTRMIGAVVSVEAGGRTQTQQVTVGGGHGGGVAGPLHFGLGSAEEARVSVRDASGAVIYDENLPAGQIVTISVPGN